jgi:hypothetical protein
MLQQSERAEICATIETLRGELERLAVRGLRTASAEDLRALSSAQEELARIGAEHVAGRLAELLSAVRDDARDGAARLLRTQTSLRVFERVLTLEDVGARLADDDDGKAPATEAATEPPIAAPERKKLLPVLDDLAAAVEDLIGTGLTTASAATRQKLDVSFKEASRLKLLRLAASLRYVNEEIGRFLENNAAFSAKRFSFFLNRSWLLARGIAHAIRDDDAKALAKLLWTTSPKPLAEIEVVTVGVLKRVAKGSSISFDFRLRSTKDGRRLVWSCLFADKGSVPAEAYLHLPQPQKFPPKVFLEPNPIIIREAAISDDRIILGAKSSVEQGKQPWKKWKPFFPEWDRAATRRRLTAHSPSPLDLEVELQEEVVLDDWKLGEPRTVEGQKRYPVVAGDLELEAIVPDGAAGAELEGSLEALRKRAKRPPLLGLVHFDLCRLVLQPLATLEVAGPKHLMISNDKIDLKSLLGTLEL